MSLDLTNVGAFSALRGKKIGTIWFHSCALAKDLKGKYFCQRTGGGLGLQGGGRFRNAGRMVGHHQPDFHAARQHRRLRGAGLDLDTRGKQSEDGAIPPQWRKLDLSGSADPDGQR